MTDQDRLNCYELVNNAENFEQIKAAIIAIGSLGPGGNTIIGKTKTYGVTKLLENLEYIRNNKSPYVYNYVTREFGLRQQIIYLHNYGEV